MDRNLDPTDQPNVSAALARNMHAPHTAARPGARLPQDHHLSLYPGDPVPRGIYPDLKGIQTPRAASPGSKPQGTHPQGEVYAHNASPGG